MPSIKLYTRSGVVTVNFRHIQTYHQQHQQFLTQQQQESIEKFNTYLSQHFYRQFVSEDSLIYDKDADESDQQRIAKAVVVPLKKDAFLKMEQEGKFGDFLMKVDTGYLLLFFFSFQSIG